MLSKVYALVGICGLYLIGFYGPVTQETINLLRARSPPLMKNHPAKHCAVRAADENRHSSKAGGCDRYRSQASVLL